MQDQETSQRRPWRRKVKGALFVFFLCVGMVVFTVFKMPQNDIETPSFKEAFVQTFHTYFVTSVQTFVDDHWLSAEEKKEWRERYEKFPDVFRVRVLPKEQDRWAAQVLEILKVSNKGSSYQVHHGKLEIETVSITLDPSFILTGVSMPNIFNFLQEKYVGSEVLIFGSTGKSYATKKKGLHAYKAFLIPRDLDKNILPYLRNLGAD